MAPSRDGVDVLLPLAVGIATTVSTIFIHALAHYLYGGWWQVFRIFRPAALVVSRAVKPKPLMIAAGVLELFFGQVANGLWIAFIGWFLLSAAASEEAGSNIRALLRSVPVSAAMRSPVVTLPDWVTVEQFLESVAPNHSFTTYPIHEPSGKLTGVVRLSDLVRLPAADRATKHLIDVARPIADVPVTNPREDLSALIQRIGAGLEQRVLVFDNGALVGIVSPADVARVLTLRQSLTAAPKA